MMQIKVSNVALGYENKAIVKDISFEINKGDYIAIIGENGSGKTTLIKTILNLNKAISGDITYNDISKKDIGYLPQKTDVQNDFPASVFEVVLSGFEGKRFRFRYTKEEKEEAFLNLALVKADELLDKSFLELSGGQMQRVLMARALCASKKILFVDEPTSALDHKGIEETYKLLDTLNKNLGMTIVMISHDLNSVLKYANKILSFDNGFKVEVIK